MAQTVVLLRGLLPWVPHLRWITACRTACGTRARPSRPRACERKTTHRADAHFAGNAVAGNLAGEFERQRHRVGDRNLPGKVIATGFAVENLGRIAFGLLRARQRAARALQAERRL